MSYLVPNRVTMAREVLELTADYARHCADAKTPQARMEGVACLCEILGEFLKEAEPAGGGRGGLIVSHSRTLTIAP